MEWLFGPRTPGAFIARAQKDDPPHPAPGYADDLGRRLYAKLERRLPADVRRLFDNGTVAIGELGRLIPEAMTYPVNKGYAIFFYTGMSRFLYRVSRALHTRVNVYGNRGLVAPASVPIERTIEIITEIFGNYMNDGKIAGPNNYPIARDQVEVASMLATSAETFFVAHEIAHVMIGRGAGSDVSALSQSEEIEADRLALTYVLGVNGEPDCMREISPRMAYAGAEFGLRVLSCLAHIGYQFQETHPPPAQRLSKVRELASDLSGSYRDYIRISTIAFSHDQLLEDVELRLLKLASGPGSVIGITVERIMSTLSAIVEEYGGKRLPRNEAISETVKLFSGVPVDLARHAADKAVEMYVQEPARQSASSDKVGTALFELGQFFELVKALPDPPSGLFDAALVRITGRGISTLP